MEHMLRSSLIATRIAERMGLDAQQRATVCYANLVGWIGCHADSHELSALFGDDIAFRADTYGVDMAGLPFLRLMVNHVGRGMPAWEQGVARPPSCSPPAIRLPGSSTRIARRRECSPTEWVWTRRSVRRCRTYSSAGMARVCPTAFAERTSRSKSRSSGWPMSSKFTFARVVSNGRSTSCAPDAARSSALGGRCLRAECRRHRRRIARNRRLDRDVGAGTRSWPYADRRRDRRVIKSDG